MAETRDSVAETQRQTRVSEGGYITVFHVYNRNRPLVYMFAQTFVSKNLLLRSFYRRKREDTVRQSDWFFRVSIRFRCRYCLNTSNNWVTHLRKPSFPVGIFLYSYMKLTFEYFSQLTYMQWRLVHYIIIKQCLCMFLSDTLKLQSEHNCSVIREYKISAKIFTKAWTGCVSVMFPRRKRSCFHHISVITFPFFLVSVTFPFLLIAWSMFQKFCLCELQLRWIKVNLLITRFSITRARYITCKDCEVCEVAIAFDCKR